MIRRLFKLSVSRDLYRNFSYSRPKFHSKPSPFGQPLSSTHPHLFSSPDELTPGTTLAEYQERRQRLCDQLNPGDVAIIKGARLQYVSNAVFHQFRQSSNFLYLTGFNEPDATLVLFPTSTKCETIMFLTPRDKSKQMWSGGMNGLTLAVERFGMTEALPNESLESRLKTIIADSKGTIYSDHKLDGILYKCINPTLAEMRRFKSVSEQKLVRKACSIAAKAHSDVMSWTACSNTNLSLEESHIAARFMYTSSLLGAQREAYVPVVASGHNALVLHYVSNNCIIDPNDAILLDAGVEYEGYTSDITRTFPATGKFTQSQSDIYGAVLNVQSALLQMLRPNSITMDALHNESKRLMQAELRAIGINASTSDVGDTLYPHFVGHSFGMDLHEVASRHSLIQSGETFTIEPGLYIPLRGNYPSELQGIGVRIEDNFLMTETGCDNLTKEAPKTVMSLESLPKIDTLSL